MPKPVQDMGQDILDQVRAEFENGEFDAGLDIFDQNRDRLQDRSQFFIAREIAKAGYPHEALYMVHNLIWEPVDDEMDFRRHADNRIDVAPNLMSDYIWILVQFERLNQDYHYPETGTLPPMGSVEVFQAYLDNRPDAAEYHSLVTDGLRAMFETVVRNSGRREYDLDAIERACDLMDQLRDETYRVPGGGFAPYHTSMRFLMWEASFNALVHDHPHVTEQAKDAAFDTTVEVINEYFDIVDAERIDTERHGRLPNVPREMGALVYALGDENLINRLETAFEPRSDLPGDAYARAQKNSDSILEKMREDAENWPFIRLGMRSTSQHLRASDLADDGSIQQIDVGARAFSDDRPVRSVHIAVRRAATEIAPGEGDDAARPASEATPQQDGLGRISRRAERVQITGKRGVTKTVIVERKPKRRKGMGEPKPRTPGKEGPGES